MVQLLLVGFGGIALMALLGLALPIFIASAGLHALNVLVLAPRIFDPLDPPDAAGLAQRRRSTLVYLVAALLGLGLIGYAFRLLRGMPGAPAWAGDTAPLGPLHAEEPPQPEPEDDETLRSASFILLPSWDEGWLFKAETRRPVFLTLPPDMLTEADWDEIQFLLAVWRDVADPADLQRCRFSTPDGSARIAAEGAWVFEQLAARLAPCWTDAEAAAHEAEGRLIAQRLARELAATGRGHVPPGFWSGSEVRLIPLQGA